LTERYGKGFSATNLGYFRQFYLAYRDRIPHPPSGESQRSATPPGIPHPAGGESLPTFHPNLSWSHYRTLMHHRSDSLLREERGRRSLFRPARKPATVRLTLSLHLAERGRTTKRAATRTRADRKPDGHRREMTAMPHCGRRYATVPVQFSEADTSATSSVRSSYGDPLHIHSPDSSWKICPRLRKSPDTVWRICGNSVASLLRVGNPKPDPRCYR
jgi:hypothetical protein